MNSPLPSTRTFHRPDLRSLLARPLRLVCAIACVCLGAAEVAAEPIVLVSKDGLMSTTGEFLGVEGGILIVETVFGTMRVPADSVTCQGAACPTADEIAASSPAPAPEATAGTSPQASVLAMSASAGIADLLFPALANGIAQNKGLVAAPEDIAVTPDGSVTSVSVEISDGAGGDAAIFRVQVEAEDAAMQLLARGEVELAFLNGPATPAQIDQVALAGAGDLSDPAQERVIAAEGVVVAVSRENPVKTLRTDSLAKILSGSITNWAELGGRLAPITVYAFPSDHRSSYYQREMILQPAGLSLAPSAVLVSSMTELRDRITADPNGVGILPYGELGTARGLPLQSTCGVVTAPSPFTIKNQEYPLNRRFYVYSRADLGESAAGFVSYLDGADLDVAVTSGGFIDMSVIEQNQVAAAERTQARVLASVDPAERAVLETLLEETATSIRLSTTFRFTEGSSSLDIRARRDVQRIADYLRRAQPSEAIFVGFSESAGPFNETEGLSFERAQAVMAAVQEVLPPELRDTITAGFNGFGKLSPVVCNDTASGRALNRRVEVWVR